MEAAVQRVAVLIPAARAHGEAPHGGVGPVVRQRVDDAVARPAVGAVGERIVIAPVFRIEDLTAAIGARGEVREHNRAPLALPVAFGYPEAGVTGRLADGGFHRRDRGVRRRLGRDPVEKLAEGSGVSFGLDDYSLR